MSRSAWIVAPIAMLIVGLLCVLGGLSPIIPDPTPDRGEVLLHKLTEDGPPAPNQGCELPSTTEVLAVANYITSGDDESEQHGFVDYGWFQLDKPLCGTSTISVTVDPLDETDSYTVGDCVNLALYDLRVKEREITAKSTAIVHAKGCSFLPVTGTVNQVNLSSDGYIIDVRLWLDNGTIADGEQLMYIDVDNGYALGRDEIREHDRVTFYPFERDFRRNSWGAVSMWMQLEWSERWCERLHFEHGSPDPSPSASALDSPTSEPSGTGNDPYEEDEYEEPPMPASCQDSYEYDDSNMPERCAKVKGEVVFVQHTFFPSEESTDADYDYPQINIAVKLDKNKDKMGLVILDGVDAKWLKGYRVGDRVVFSRPVGEGYDRPVGMDHDPDRLTAKIIKSLMVPDYDEDELEGKIPMSLVGKRWQSATGDYEVGNLRRI